MQIFRGKVRSGKKRGKDLGFPTANIKLHKALPEGIYVSWATFDSQRYPSLTFIGSAIQFGEKDYKAEVYILNFDKNIYNKWVTVQLLKKIRENMKFDSVKSLIEQMERDKKAAENYFLDSESSSE